MAGYCKVEFEALARLVTDLSGCADNMTSAMKELKDIGPKGSGFAELEEACDDFQDKWEYGIKLIAEATGGISEKVADAAKEFQGLEDKVAAALAAVKDPKGELTAAAVTEARGHGSK